MFICLKHRICCDYHKTSFGGRHGPLPIFNSRPMSLQFVCAAADSTLLQLSEWPQPHGCPTVPAWQHWAAENKEVLLVQLGTGGFELCTCLPIALFLWAAVYAHAKGVLSFLHPLLTKAEECIGTTAAWHISEYIWSLLSLANIPWDRAGPQRRVASRELATSWLLVGQPPQPLSACANRGSRCPLLPCSGEPGHLLPPSPYSALPFSHTERASAQLSAPRVPVAQVISS